MTQRVYLHVGAPKSGTTYLQGVLDTNRRRLGEAGVLVVGETHLERIHAGLVVRDDPRLADLPPRARESWSRLVEQIRQWDGDSAVLSYELLAGASVKQVRRAFADLDGLEVHVIITARDLGAAVPSAWQERLKFALTTPLEHWVPRPESAGPRAEWGWRTLDPAGVAKRWGADLPAERVHVVTVPRSSADPEELWRRFSEAAGIAVAGLDLHPERRNESLGVVQAELLRRVNARLGPVVRGSREQALWIRDTLAHGVLAVQPGERMGLTEEQHAEAAERGAAAIRRISRAGYAVHGDLDDVSATRPDARTPGEVHDAELVEAAVAAIGDLVLLVRERTHERDAALAELEEPPPEGLVGRGKRLVQNASAATLRREAERLTQRVESLESLLQDYRRLQLRVAELTDVVAELVVPHAVRDGEVTAKALRRYRKGVL